MINSQKIKDGVVGLKQQRDELQRQLFMVEGALAYCEQLLKEEGAEQAPSESENKDEVPTQEG